MKLTMSFLLLAIALLMGCAAATVYEAGQSAAAALLVVENQRTDDTWIFLGRAGEKSRRLGRVTALTTDTLVLRAADAPPGAAIQFTAIAFASGAVDQSDPMTAERGVVYRWQLGPARGHNFISARSTE